MANWFFSNKDFSDKDERKLEELIKEAVKYGAVHSTFHFDVHGKEAQAVKDTLVDVLARLTNEEGILYAKGEVEEPIGSEAEGYTSTAEAKVLTENFALTLKISMRYGPAAVEIIEPHSLKLGVQEMQDLLLSASEISKQYASYVVEKLWGKEELEKYKERVEKQIEQGRKLREKAEKENKK